MASLTDLVLYIRIVHETWPKKNSSWECHNSTTIPPEFHRFSAGNGCYIIRAFQRIRNFEKILRIREAMTILVNIVPEARGQRSGARHRPKRLAAKKNTLFIWFHTIEEKKHVYMVTVCGDDIEENTSGIECVTISIDKCLVRKSMIVTLYDRSHSAVIRWRISWFPAQNTFFWKNMLNYV